MSNIRLPTTRDELGEQLDVLQPGEQLSLPGLAFGQLFGAGGSFGNNELGAIKGFVRVHGCALELDEYDSSQPAVFRKLAAPNTSAR